MDKRFEFIEALAKVLQSSPPELDETAKSALTSVLYKTKNGVSEKELNGLVFQAFIIQSGIIASKKKPKGFLRQLISDLVKS